MAVGRDPSVSGNIRQHQRDLDRISSAPLGPVSLGVGDSIRAGGAFRLDQAGAYLLSRGSLTGLSGLVDGILDLNDGQNDQLTNHRQWIIDARAVADAAHEMNEAQNRTLSDHRDWIIGAAESAAGAKTLANTAQARADSAYSRAGTGISDAATAQSRADSAYSRAGTGISNASTAQSRADAAYSLAATKAADSRVDSEVARLVAAIRKVAQNTSTPDPFLQ